MSIGHAPVQGDLLRSSTEYCRGRVPDTSIYEWLHRECDQLFPEEDFADLFEATGRRSVPPRVVAVAMVLQRLMGLSDREAVEHFEFDLRWKYAAGGLELSYASFAHTVLVDMRARLRRSSRPDRIFEKTVEVARAAGLVGRKRVMDSTALYDAVSTQDTVTLIRTALRQVLKVSPNALGAKVRKVLKRDDDYDRPGKPDCDWDDREAREALIDALAQDAHAALGVLNGQKLSDEEKKAAELLATVVGQDLDQAPNGEFQIAQRVAQDRVISVVDPEARHGHKSKERGFDGYKGHIAIDPDSEIVTATEVTAANVGDGTAVPRLMAEVLVSSTPEDKTGEPQCRGEGEGDPPNREAKKRELPELATRLQVFGDAAYGTAEVLRQLDGQIDPYLKVPAPVAHRGLMSKEHFSVDLTEGLVTCPASQKAVIHPLKRGGGLASFGSRCATCPLRAQCTRSPDGRTIHIHPDEDLLSRERQRQKHRPWKSSYRATRPKVERKLAHMMRRRHGGRRARVRGRTRVAHDFALLAAATNLARLATLKVRLRSA
jgi:hypothetical protein